MAVLDDPIVLLRVPRVEMGDVLGLPGLGGQSAYAAAEGNRTAGLEQRAGQAGLGLHHQDGGGPFRQKNRPLAFEFQPGQGKKVPKNAKQRVFQRIAGQGDAEDFAQGPLVPQLAVALDFGGLPVRDILREMEEDVEAFSGFFPDRIDPRPEPGVPFRVVDFLFDRSAVLDGGFQGAARKRPFETVDDARTIAAEDAFGADAQRLGDGPVGRQDPVSRIDQHRIEREGVQDFGRSDPRIIRFRQYFLHLRIQFTGPRSSPTSSPAMNRGVNVLFSRAVDAGRGV